MAHAPAVTQAMLRKFGLLVGAIFALIGFKPFITLEGFVPQLVPDASPHLWAAGAGGALIVLGLVFPAALRLPYRGWMLIGAALGWVNTRIILGIVFFGLVTPLGIIKRLSGSDGMSRKLDPRAKTYRVVRRAEQTSNLSDQF
jgi:hypothetical protein